MLPVSSLAPITIPTSIQHLGHTLQNTALISSTVPNSAPHCACSHLADAIDESYHADGLGHKVPYDGIRLPYNRHALLALGSVTRCLMMGSGCLVTGMPNKAQMTFPTKDEGGRQEGVAAKIHGHHPILPILHEVDKRQVRYAEAQAGTGELRLEANTPALLRGA